MMKIRKYLILFGVIISVTLSGQISNGSIAQDFVLTDINGNEHRLYEYLDSGKAVIIDFFTAWCGPCWSFHNNGTLEEMWNVYGPDGLDELMIFSIELEENNTLDQLYGLGNSQGNFVEGTPYPIMDNGEHVGDAFEISAYPTVMIIRPGGQVFKQYPGNPFFIFEYYALNKSENNGYIYYLPDNDNINNVQHLCPEQPISGTVRITNLGTEILDNCTVIVKINQINFDTIRLEGEIDMFNSRDFHIEVYPDNEPQLRCEFEVYLVNDERERDLSNYGNSWSQTYFVNSSVDSLQILMRTDFWPEETSWYFKNSTGDVLDSHESLGILECDTEYRQVLYFQGDDCYSVELYDSAEDGIDFISSSKSHICTTENGWANSPEGYYQIVKSDGDAVKFGTYYFKDKIIFNVNGSGNFVTSVDRNEIIEDINISVSPNPSADILYIYLIDDTVDINNIHIYDIKGKLINAIKNLKKTNKVYPLDISQYIDGIYLLKIETKFGFIYKRIIKN